MSHKISALDAIIYEAEQEAERVEGARAKVAAEQRCLSQYGTFLKRATSKSEVEQRLNLVANKLRDTVAAICTEYHYDSPAKLEEHVLAFLRHACDCECGPGCDKDGCDKEDCKCKPAEKESAVKEAVDPTVVDINEGIGAPASIEEGGNSSYHADRIDDDSKVHPLTEMTMEPDREQPDMLGDPTKNDSAVKETVNPETHMDSEEVGPATSTFPNKGQTNPVQASKTASETCVHCGQGIHKETHPYGIDWFHNDGNQKCEDGREYATAQSDLSERELSELGGHGEVTSNWNVLD